MSTNTNEPDIRPEVAEAAAGSAAETAAAERTARLEALAAKLADRVKDLEDPEWRPIFYDIGDLESQLGPDVVEAVRNDELDDMPAEVMSVLNECWQFASTGQSVVPLSIMPTYLPARRYGDIVLAAIHINSTIGEVVELRCWFRDGLYHYDFVDEHGHSSRAIHHPELPQYLDPSEARDVGGDPDVGAVVRHRMPITTSETPLSLAQMIRLMKRCGDITWHWDIFQEEGGMSAEEAVDAYTLGSDVYPGLDTWFDELQQNYGVDDVEGEDELSWEVTIAAGSTCRAGLQEVWRLTIEGEITYEIESKAGQSLGNLHDLRLHDGARIPDYGLLPLNEMKWTLADGRTLWCWKALEEAGDQEVEAIRNFYRERAGEGAIEYWRESLPLKLEHLEVYEGCLFPEIPLPALSELLLDCGVEVPDGVDLSSVCQLWVLGGGSIPTVPMPDLAMLRLGPGISIHPEFDGGGMHTLGLGAGCVVPADASLEGIETLAFDGIAELDPGLELPSLSVVYLVDDGPEPDQPAIISANCRVYRRRSEMDWWDPNGVWWDYQVEW